MNIDERLRTLFRPEGSSSDTGLDGRLPALKTKIIRRSRKRRFAKMVLTAVLSVALVAGVVSASVVVLNGREYAGRSTAPAGGTLQVSRIEMSSVGPIAANAHAIVVDSGNTYAEPLEGLSIIDPASEEVTDLPPVTLGGDQLAYADGALWVTGGPLRGRSGWLEKIDADGTDKFQTLRLEGLPNGVAVDDSGVWIANLAGNYVWQAAPSGERVRSKVEIGAPTTAILSAYDALWTTTKDGFLIRIDPTTGDIAFRVAVSEASCPGSLSAGDGSIWVADSCSDSLRRFDPEGGRLEASIPTPDQPSDVVFRGGQAWVTSAAEDVVVQIDAATNAQIGAPIRVGSQPMWILAAFGDIWTANIGDNSISRISLE